MLFHFFRGTARQLPTFLQSQITECGLTCLAMIAAWYGHQVNLAGLRRRFPVSNRGMNLKQLIEVGTRLHFNCRPLKLEAESLKDLHMPSILHWDMNHFVVLKSVRGDKVVIHDPARGVIVLSMDDVKTSFTGIALELRPTQEFVPIVEKLKIKASQLFGHIEGIHKNLVLVAVLSIILMATVMSLPIFTQLVFDEVIGSADQQLLSLLMLGLASVVIFRAIVGFLRGYLLLFMGNVLSFHAGASVFRHLIHLPLKYFSTRHIGDVISRFQSLEQIKNFLTQGMVEVVVDGIMAIMMLALMFVYSIKLSLVAVATIILYALIRFLTLGALRRVSEDVIVSQAKEQSNFMETVRGIQSIKLYGGQADRHGLWQNIYAKVLDSNASLGRFRVSFQTCRELIFALERVIVIYIGVHSVFERSLSPGMLIAFLAYKDQFADKIASLIENGIQYKMLDLHFDRISDIVLEESEMVADEGDFPEEIEGHFQLKNLSYRYDSQSPYIFKELNLDVNAGECVSIIGPSGVGKSTLLRIMVGLYRPESGEVLVDGASAIKNRSAYQKQTATVMQDDQLLSGSIADNIAFFDSNPDPYLVYQCAEKAQIHKDILRMPMRYESLIGDMGSSLSGGQKQRLLLARALYRKPRILFLDEATSHLDQGVEALVNSAVGELKITRIIIAHRAETILSADRIFQMHEGQLIEIEKAAYRRVVFEQSEMSALAGQS